MSGRSATELVADLVQSESRIAAYMALNELGAEALPAIKEGVGHDRWEVRKWCAMLLDHLADDEALYALIPLLQDPKNEVRLWAVHSISCEGCKVGENPIDTVPLLLERIEVDESIRVRRMAAAMLSHECTAPDPRVIPVFQRILANEDDRKLKFHAQRGLDRYAKAGSQP